MIRDRDTLNALLDSVARFVRERLIPAEHVVAETDEIPEDIVADMKELGLFGLTIPEEYGGLGLTMEEEALVIMAMGQTSPAFRSLFGTTVGIGSQGILLDGPIGRREISAEARDRRDSRLIRADRARSRIGRRFVAHDRSARRRHLRRQRHKALHHERAACRHLHADGAHKSRGQGAPVASTAFIVERTRLASVRQAVTRRWGRRARTRADVIFENCRVPAAQVIGGKEGRVSRPR